MHKKTRILLRVVNLLLGKVQLPELDPSDGIHLEGDDGLFELTPVLLGNETLHLGNFLLSQLPTIQNILGSLGPVRKELEVFLVRVLLGETQRSHLTVRGGLMEIPRLTTLVVGFHPSFLHPTVHSVLMVHVDQTVPTGDLDRPDERVPGLAHLHFRLGLHRDELTFGSEDPKEGYQLVVVLNSDRLHGDDIIRKPSGFKN